MLVGRGVGVCVRVEVRVAVCVGLGVEVYVRVGAGVELKTQETDGVSPLLIMVRAERILMSMPFGAKTSSSGTRKWNL